MMIIDYQGSFLHKNTPIDSVVEGALQLHGRWDVKKYQPLEAFIVQLFNDTMRTVANLVNNINK